MLDQNTDRMWYVIGAVIVGAAIIVIMNKTFPQLFASVGDTFQGKTEQTTEIVDGIMPNTYKNLYTGDDVYWSANAVGYGQSMGDRIESVLQSNIEVKPNTTYELTYHKNAKSNFLIVLTQSGETTLNAHNAMFGDTIRIRELANNDPDNRSAKKVSWEFTTGSTEKYVSITTGNSAVVDVPFGVFEVDFRNILLREVVK